MEEGMTLFEINSNPFYWGMHAYVKIKYDKIGRVVRENFPNSSLENGHDFHFKKLKIPLLKEALY